MDGQDSRHFFPPIIAMVFAVRGSSTGQKRPGITGCPRRDVIWNPGRLILQQSPRSVSGSARFPTWSDSLDASPPLFPFLVTERRSSMSSPAGPCSLTLRLAPQVTVSKY